MQQGQCANQASHGRVAGKAADVITSSGGRAAFAHLDVTSEGEWVRVVAEVVRTHGRIDILLNNAAVAVTAASIADVSLADWRRQQPVNLEGTFLGIKHALPVIRRAGGRSIINMSSTAGLRGALRMAACSATTGAIRLLTKSVAIECAAADDHVRVNSVHPGMIATPGLARVSQPVQRAARVRRDQGRTALRRRRGDRVPRIRRVGVRHRKRTGHRR